MMRPIAFVVISVAPAAPNPFSLVVTGSATVAPAVVLTWTDPTPPSAPTTLGNPKNEIGFRIDRAVGAGAFNPLVTALANSTTFTDTLVVPGTTYRYRVVTFNAAGQTATASLSANIPTTNGWPISPTGLVANISPNGAGVQVNLSWTANAINTTAYVLGRTGGTGTFTTVSLLGRTNNTYTDTEVTIGATYVYSVYAVNGAAVATVPTTLSVTVRTPPATPTNVTATNITQTTVTLNWLPGTGFSNIQIYYSQNGSTWTLFYTTGPAVTSKTLAGLSRNTTYFFRIRADLTYSTIAYSNFAPAPPIQIKTLP